MSFPKKISAVFLCVFFSLAFPSHCFAAHNYKGIGYDISYPNCFQLFPKGAFGIVGANGGKAFTPNPCLLTEFSWASTLPSSHVSLYMNLNAPIGSTADEGLTGPSTVEGTCLTTDELCQSFNYGYRAAEYAYKYASENHITVPSWWLDIETENSWFDNPLMNVAVIRGAIAFFQGGLSPNRVLIQGKGLSVGVYSTAYMWSEITGDWPFKHVPAWVATDDNAPPEHCPEAFTGKGNTSYLVQFYDEDYRLDANYACP